MSSRRGWLLPCGICFASGIVGGLLALIIKKYEIDYFWEAMSAIGTIGAVVVSLYLANRPKRQGKLEVFDNKLHIVLNTTSPYPDSELEVLELRVSCFVKNSGETSLLIKGARCTALNAFTTLMDEEDSNILLQPGEIRELRLKSDISNIWYVGHDMWKVLRKKDAMIGSSLHVDIVGGNVEKFNFKRTHTEHRAQDTSQRFALESGEIDSNITIKRG